MRQCPSLTASLPNLGSLVPRRLDLHSPQHGSLTCSIRKFGLLRYMYTPPTDDMVCLSQGVIQTSTVLGGTVSYFVVSTGKLHRPVGVN